MPSAPTKRAASGGWRALSWTLLVLALVVGFQAIEAALTSWIVPPLPPGIDVPRVEAFVAEVDERLTKRAASGDLEALRVQLERVWATLDDRKGGHLFFDSEFKDSAVRLEPTTRVIHLELVGLLRRQPTRLAPPPAVDPQDETASNGDSAGQRVATLSLALAQAFRRLGARVESDGQPVDAIEYFEGALRLLCVIQHRVELSSIHSISTEYEYCAQFSRSSLSAYPEPVLREQVLSALAETRAAYPSFAIAIETETKRVWDARDPRLHPRRFFAWQRAQDNRSSIVRLEYLRRFRELCTAPRSSPEEREQALSELGSLLDDEIYHKTVALLWERFRLALEGVDRSTSAIVEEAAGGK